MTFIPSKFFGVDVSAVYHVGYVVEDLTSAMKQFNEAIGARWADHYVQARYRSATNTIVEVELHSAFTLDGPTHIEMIEAAPNTIWALDGAPGLHHIGLWTDDIPGEAQRLAVSGLPAVATGIDPEDDSVPAFFSYHENPLGSKVELVDIRWLGRMNDWIRPS